MAHPALALGTSLRQSVRRAILQITDAPPYCPVCFQVASEKILECFCSYTLRECTGCGLQSGVPAKCPAPAGMPPYTVPAMSGSLALEPRHRFFLRSRSSLFRSHYPNEVCLPVRSALPSFHAASLFRACLTAIAGKPPRTRSTIPPTTCSAGIRRFSLPRAGTPGWFRDEIQESPEKRKNCTMPSVPPSVPAWCSSSAAPNTPLVFRWLLPQLTM
jgi:hypothetical protein